MREVFSLAPMPQFLTIATEYNLASGILVWERSGLILPSARVSCSERHNVRRLEYLSGRFLPCLPHQHHHIFLCQDEAVCEYVAMGSYWGASRRPWQEVSLEAFFMPDGFEALGHQWPLFFGEAVTCRFLISVTYYPAVTLCATK